MVKANRWAFFRASTVHRHIWGFARRLQVSLEFLLPKEKSANPSVCALFQLPGQ
ncbi:hypothetical protein KKY_2124 [Pelagibacterium halotolerans B2]|uniref:Uncharacterized protein n=1 Tax=Pelagibacterium halotolerans (strain DSM 22347 / JCM 15775 / CGMCC 1.7692 / B2) TaxID=1082931 RepID=G4RGU4_PELHB|nr:hypothetical protein KKY_2124 [Pelagibacterium halotolerans B2]